MQRLILICALIAATLLVAYCLLFIISYANAQTKPPSRMVTRHYNCVSCIQWDIAK